MQDLIKHEQFEMEVIEKLYKGKVLSKLIFVGGTMLRLCYGLDRYSVDLDFWIYKKEEKEKIFNEIKKIIVKNYTVKDIYNKHFTMFFEFKSNKSHRALKIEVRKEKKDVKPVKAIAYTPHSNIQVIVNTLSLNNMMEEKIKALINRCEIRDAYDVEFLLKKGVKLNIDFKKAFEIKKIILGFKKADYKVKLSSILPPEKRKYYTESNFKILLSALDNI